jgi:gamma-glutamyltranspeptidase/glutathione hydrolase
VTPSIQKEGNPVDSFIYDFPYPSQRMPVMAKNVVATSQPLAAQAGLQMLQQGGNALDAALATAIALTVVEPTSNGIGSDAFCILWNGHELHGLNASGRSPAALTPERFAGQSAVPLRGWDPVTVPGAVSAWVTLSERFGTLPFEALFAPAIRYAREGFLVSPITARAWKSAEKTFADMPEFGAAFLPGGRAPRAGELFRFEDQARTLEAIAQSRGEAFYRGELAEKMTAHARASGGLLTEEDLATHQADWSGTLAQDYRGVTLHEIPPNGQGLAALLMLGILEHHPVADYPADSADSLHVQLEAMKLAFADAHRYVSDPASADIDVNTLLEPDYLAERAKLIDMTRAQDPSYGVPQRGGTVYLTAADASGMMVSFIQSNYYGFGSGIVVPGTGISLQNRGAGFTLEKGHPNEVGGNKRPFHTIIPAFLMQNGAPLMSFGVMGGPMQPQGHAQMVIRLRDYAQNPQAASDAPRWQVMGGLSVAVERGFGTEVLDELRARGHELREVSNDSSMFFGGAQLIYRLEDGYVAASDYRRDGQAVGF